MPNSVSDDQPRPRAQVRRATTAGMGYRLAAGGLASRRVALAKPPMEAPPAHNAWEPILPEAWSQSRIVGWLLATAQKRSLRPAVRLRWSWLKNETIYEAVFLSTASGMVLTLMLYWGKSHAALIDGEIGRVIHQAQDARQHTYTLRAEWASLNDPGRLQPMADRYLAMKRIDPSQFVQPEKLPDRLDNPPPAAEPEAAPAPEPDVKMASVQDEQAGSRVAPSETPVALPDEVPAITAVEAPKADVVEAPAIRAVEAAKAKIVEAPKVKVVDVPAIRAVEAPKAKVVASTVSRPVEAPSARPSVPTISASSRIYRVAAHVPAPTRVVSPPPNYAAPTFAQSFVTAMMHAARHIAAPAAAAPAPRPELPRWLTQTPLHATRAVARTMSEAPHKLGVPAIISLPLTVTKPRSQQEQETRRYLTIAAQLPALRRPAFAASSLPHFYRGSPGSSYSMPAPLSAVSDEASARYEPPPYMGAVESSTSSD